MYKKETKDMVLCVCVYVYAYMYINIHILHVLCVHTHTYTYTGEIYPRFQECKYGLKFNSQSM